MRKPTTKLKSNIEPSITQRKRAHLVLITLVSFFILSHSSHIFFTNADALIKLQNSQEGECDLFSGEWIPDNSTVSYTNDTCKFIPVQMNCLTNGRPDTEYLYWTWKPHNCQLPQTNPTKFLNAMRNKALVLIGDSIIINQWESLLCFLIKVEEPILVHHDQNYKSQTLYFPIYNATLGLIWAPYLVKSTESRSEDDIEVWLDIVDKAWTYQYQKYNYILLAAGQWFLDDIILWENGTIIGCNKCPRKDLRKLGVYYPYRRALKSIFSFMSTSNHNPEIIILRTRSPDHFEYEKWIHGGICNRTKPYIENQYIDDLVDQEMRRIEIEEFNGGLNMGLPLRLLDTYHMSAMRPDAHPGPYWKSHPDINKKPKNDCIHWCLPGLVDIWNEILMHIIVNEVEVKSPY